MAVFVITEDGTGRPDATTYCSESESDAHFEQTGRKDTWKGFSRSQRLAALNFGAKYMDDVYRNRYLGDIQESTRDTQALLWPRENVPNPRAPSEALAASPVPMAIHRANAEFALAFLKDGNEDLFGAADPGTPITTEKEVEVVGAVRKREKFSGGGVSRRRRRYPLAEAALAPYITRSQQRVIRA